MIGYIFQHQIAAEAGGAGVEDPGMECAADIFQNSAQIGVTVLQSDPGVIVISMARPVENDKGSVIVFFQDPGGKLVGHGIVLVTGKTVAEDDDMSE
jgi:hypothetical protein